MKKLANNGDHVTIDFVAKLKDGTSVLSTSNSGPFPFVVDGQMMFKKVSDAVVGMTEGEKKTLDLSPEDAFGEVDDRLVVEVPVAQIPGNIKVGSVLSHPDDPNQEWRVLEVKDKTVLVDGNHPLAGKVLTFEFTLVSIGQQGGTPSGNA